MSHCLLAVGGQSRYGVWLRIAPVPCKLGRGDDNNKAMENGESFFCVSLHELELIRPCLPVQHDYLFS